MIHSDDDLRIKCIPYIFLTNEVMPNIITTAYALSIQGFFRKPNNHKELKMLLQKIVEYWEEGLTP